MATTGTNSLSGAAGAFTPGTGAMTGKQETLSEWAGPYVTSMLGKAEALSNMPYQAYQGPLTAGASPLQQKLFSGLGGLDFPGRLGQSFTATDAPTLPTMTATGQALPTASQPTGIAAQYMNPYLSAVLAPQLSELQRQAQISQMNQASKLSKAGAFGGSRQAIMDAELQRNLLNEANKAIGQGYAAAYDKGLGQFNTEFGQAKDIAGMMSGAGATQRDIETEGIKADLAAFESERDFPYKQLQFQQSMLQGMPIQSTAASYQQPSSMTNFLNTTGGLMDLYQRIFGGTTPPKK
jgi:hypothetical protein